MHILGAIVFLFVLWTANAEATCSGSGQTWYCPTGASAADVQLAINSANDGATISFEAGAYTWSSSIALSNAKGVTLQGAGSTSTIVTVGTSNIIILDSLSGDNTKLYRITGFTFQNAPANTIIWFYGNGTLSNLRIDHNTFSNFADGSIAIIFGATNSANKIYGLIDHNLFTGSINFMGIKYMGPGSPLQWPSSVKGTANNLFIEDNTFNFTSATASSLGSGCIDSWRAASVVFRFNTVKNCLVTAHGVTHGTTVNHEIYYNTFERTAGSGGLWEDGTRLYHHQGSGEIMVWRNTWKHVGLIGAGALSITHYRSADPSIAGYDAGLGRCTGGAAIDGNITPSTTYYGYPCWLQPGRAPGGGSSIYGTLSPIYAWQNIDNSTGYKVPIAIENPWGALSPTVSDHIKANRDYYDAVSNSAQLSSTSPFNGTTGMGFGTLANRPITCTTNPNEFGGGVGYFATDEGTLGTLYRCSAANTWTVHYIPYTYPHPLQALGTTRSTNPQDIPSNVQVR